MRNLTTEESFRVAGANLTADQVLDDSMANGALIGGILGAFSGAGCMGGFGFITCGIIGGFSGGLAGLLLMSIPCAFLADPAEVSQPIQPNYSPSIIQNQTVTIYYPWWY